MKGGVAAMIFAMEALKKSNISLQRGIMFTGVIDEEINFKGIHNLLSQNSITNCTAAIVGEPTNLNICIAQKGALEYQVETFGKYAHSGMAFKGENAILHMMKIISGLEAYSQEASSIVHSLLQHPTVNVGTIHGGTGITFVPDRCRIEFDRQTLPGEDSQTIHRELHNLIQKIASLNGFRAELLKLQEFDAWEIDQASPLVYMVKQAYHQALDKVAILEGFYAYSEADLLAKFGIPSLILGPGRIDQAHSPDEYVSVNQVIKATRLYAVLGYNFATGK
jgi:acetylornithine deacetylase/succinyl-diaminopimelate desuccinylase-like protein